MKRTTSIRSLLCAAMCAGLLLAAGCAAKPAPAENVNTKPGNSNAIGNVDIGNNANSAVATNAAVDVNAGTALIAPIVAFPVRGFNDRVTKKPFGIYITPKTSPVQPERFTGYHAGSDAETTPDEQNVDVPVFSVAVGTVTFVSRVNGYGGVIMVRYAVDGETVTALYGHIRLASASVKVGDAVATGQKLAVLGTGFTDETDGERKHLHSALLKGASSVVRGYVASKGALSPWYDPVAWLKDHGAAEPSA